MLNGFSSMVASGASRFAARRRVFNGLLESLEPRQLLSASPSASPLLLVQPDSGSGFSGYSPAQIASAYAFNHVSLPTGTKAGAGQTIAIIDAYSDPNITSDLSTFDSHFSLSAPPTFKIVSQTGSTSSLPATNASWGVEITLDVEWAHAMAPGANILLVEANSANDSDLLTAVNYARSASGVSVVSMSWGGPDFSGQSTYDSTFTTPSGHAPVTFIASSGDSGSSGGPDWPADSPNVLAVGGTSISISASSALTSETGWSGSTGGVSSIVTEPAYQRVAQTTGHRTEPDVSYDADPNTGFALYDSLASSGLSGWYIAGGTSAGSPQWASLIAIADQLRASAGKATLDGPSTTLPTLYSAYASSSTYAADFHDVTSGSSSSTISAKVGYDEVTGIGSPKASAVVSTLVNNSTTAAVVTKAVSTSVVTHVKAFSRHHVITADASDNARIEPATVAMSSLPSAGTLILHADSPSSVAPAGTFAQSVLFTSNPIAAAAGRSIAIDDDAQPPVTSDVASGDDDLEIPDPTSSDAPLDANHPFWHITEAIPAPPNQAASTTIARLTDDVQAPHIFKAAAVLGLTALLITMAASRSRKTKASAAQKSQVVSDTLWL
jgi:hypothetical protein